MLKTVKLFLKKHFLILKVRNRFSAEVQISQRALYNEYQRQAKSDSALNLNDAGFRVFSQFEEDGKLLMIFAAIGMTNKQFIEIGSDDGINSNSANLYFNFGWNGLFIDGNNKSIKRGEYFFSKYPHSWMYTPTFLCDLVKAENVDSLITKGGLMGEIGFLSIDIDGNDYWVWDAISVVTPQVVMIETHCEFGLNDVVVPYNPDYVYPGKHPDYHGASPVAMTKLAERKGYRLVGANDLGFNLIYVKNGLVEKQFPKVSVESVLQHPSAIDGQKKFDAIKDWEYLQG